MEISGPRVKCANCGMIYERPPAEKAFWIGVPFRIVGSEKCPRCGSNAADPLPTPPNTYTVDTSYWQA